MSSAFIINNNMSTIKRIQGDYIIESLTNVGEPIKGVDGKPSSINPDLHETIIKTSFLRVNGDLIVLGDTTHENINEVSIENPVVTLNSIMDDSEPAKETICFIPPTTVPEYPNGVTKLPVAGLEINLGLVDRSTCVGDDLALVGPVRTNVQLRYNDSSYDGTSGINTGFWEASDDGTTYYELNKTASLFSDKDPHLGGHLIVNNYRITSNQDANNPVIPPGQGTIESGEISIEAQTKLFLSSPEIRAENPLMIKNVPVGDPDPVVDPEYNTLYAKAVGQGGTGLYVTNDQASDELVSRQQALVYALIL